jgi:hypothetical protein
MWNLRANGDRVGDHLTRETLADDNVSGARVCDRMDESAEVGSACHAGAFDRHALTPQLPGGRTRIVEG